MSGAVFLETERLDLRSAEDQDLEFLRELKNRPEIRRYHPELYPRNREQIQQWLNNVNKQEGNLFLVIWKDNERVGEASLSKVNDFSAGTGISIHSRYQGNGYATETMEKLVEFGFNEWGLERIFSGVLEFNKPSQKVWEKLGFEKEAVHRDYTYCNNDFQDLIEYGLLKEEWISQKKKQSQK